MEQITEVLFVEALNGFTGMLYLAITGSSPLY